MSRFIGIDFGTTNSAIAFADGDRPPRLLELPGTSEASAQPTWRSVLYFEEGGRGREPEVTAGAQAISRYLETGGDGRFIQSMKSHLASRLFSKTTILGRNFSLEDLISTYLLKMRSVVEADLGDTAVVGRPVRYWGASAKEDDARAIGRMTRGLEQAGFTNVVFEHESSAAAAKYATSIEAPEVVLIADFGGGTSDFSLLRIAPGLEAEVLATGGVGIGGDTFDGALVDHLVAPALGKGTSYSDAFGAPTEIPRTLYSNLRRWHHLAFLKSRKNMDLLDRIHGGADEPEAVARFIHLVENDLGLPLHRSVEACKMLLSVEERGGLDFQERPISIRVSVDRVSFEEWIERELDKLDQVVDTLVRESGVAPDEIRCVFTTGGSSFVPAVRKRLEKRFPGRLRGGDELTSVALGLAREPATPSPDLCHRLGPGGRRARVRGDRESD